MVEALSRSSSLVLRSNGRRKPVTAATAEAAAAVTAATPPFPIELSAVAQDSLSLPPAKRVCRDVDALPSSKAAHPVLTVGRLATLPRQISMVANGPPHQECSSRPPTARTTRTRTTTTAKGETQRCPNLNGSVRTDYSGAGSPTATAGATNAITNHASASGRLTVPSSATSAGRGDQRKLRSQDGRLHLKSDLSLFFPNYDEIINDEDDDGTAESDFLALDSTILILDDRNARRAPPAQSPRHTTSPRTARKQQDAEPHRWPSDSRPVQSHVAAANADPAQAACRVQKLDLSSIERGMSKDQDDPLPDSIYLAAHQRAERREKRLRNIERNKAQHEKDSLERLLEGLQGPDWLRVMGISGITDTEKRAFEPKRDLFIRHVSALIRKFKAWKEEERRRKVESDRVRKERAQADNDEDEDEDEDDDNDEDEEEENEESEEDDCDDHAQAEERGKRSSSRRRKAPRRRSSGKRREADANDVDDSAARQLHHEATLAKDDGRDGETGEPAARKPRLTLKLRRPESPPEQPFTSFFSKRYQRDAAMGRRRRSGRNVMAFGHPVPDMAQRDFELPPDILTPDAILARARRRRRLRRDARDTRDAPARPSR